MCSDVTKALTCVHSNAVEVEDEAVMRQYARMRDMPVVSKLRHVKLMWGSFKISPPHTGERKLSIGGNQVLIFFEDHQVVLFFSHFFTFIYF